MRVRRFFSRLLAVTAKEIRHIARDSRVVYLALGMPLLLLVLFGFAISFDLENLDMVVADADRTPSSRRLVDGFTGTKLFNLVGVVTDPSEIEKIFRRGEARVGVVIGRGFERDLKRGRIAKVQLLLDGSDNTTAQLATGYAAGVAQSQSRKLLEGTGLTGALPLQAKVKIRFNPQMKSSHFIVPGLFAVVLATLAVLLTALSISREWERGSMEQLFATPVGRLEVILGKLLPYLGLGVVQVLLLLALSTWLFDLPVEGSIWLLGAASLLFLASMLGQGLLLGVATKNQQVATQAGVVSTLLPAFLLSGFMFPIENMPPLLQGISSIIPARYFIDAVRGILLKGAGPEDLWLDFVAMAAFAVAMTVLGTLRFKRRVA